jgi:hypothetical protein
LLLLLLFSKSLFILKVYFALFTHIIDTVINLLKKNVDRMKILPICTLDHMMSIPVAVVVAGRVAVISMDVLMAPTIAQDRHVFITYIYIHIHTYM